MRCVPLAVGFDRFGDIRFPAGVCGVRGFCPSSARISTAGLKSPVDGSRSKGGPSCGGLWKESIGAIANFTDDLVLFAEQVLSSGGQYEESDPR